MPGSHLIDLSHLIESGMITYKGLPAPLICDHLSREQSRRLYAEGTEFQIGRIDMVANTGTYLDTPFHRYPQGHDLSGLDLSRVVDVPGIVVEGPASGATTAAALGRHDDLRGRAVLVDTGGDRHWAPEPYGDPSHPYLGEDAAHALIEAEVAVVGIDSVNIDTTVGGERPIHTALLAAGIPIVEHLTNLPALAGRPFRFTAAPPAVVGMGTFPVRAVAVVDT